MTEGAQSIPEGFARHFKQSPVTDAWEPLYSRRTADAVVIGLRLAAAHTNSRGLIHGGVIAALADNAMGLSCGLKLEQGLSLVTVSLAVDYLGTAGIGQWLAVETAFTKAGKTLRFAQSFVRADDADVARANATFRVIRL